MKCHLKCYGVRVMVNEEPTVLLAMPSACNIYGPVGQSHWVAGTVASRPAEGPSLDNQSSRIKPGTRGEPRRHALKPFCLITPAERIGFHLVVSGHGEPKNETGDRMKGKIVRIVAALGSLTALIVAGSASMKIG